MFRRTIRRRVERGAAYLDSVKPNWADRVDLRSLDMDDSYLCVAGQVFGAYGRLPYLAERREMSDELFLRGLWKAARRVERERERWAVAHGFNFHIYSARIRVSEEEWAKVIEKRKVAAPVTASDAAGEQW